MNENFTKDDYNFLCEHFALSFTEKVYDLMKKLGYKDVGELVNQVGSFKK